MYHMGTKSEKKKKKKVIKEGKKKINLLAPPKIILSGIIPNNAFISWRPTSLGSRESSQGPS